MKRLLLLTLVSLVTVTALGCGTGRGMLSRCRLFNSGFRGDACGTCATPAPCSPSFATPCETVGPVYSQSIPVYDGYSSCGGCSGFGGCSMGGCGVGFDSFHSGFGGCNSGCCGTFGGFGGCSGGSCGGFMGGCAGGNCGIAYPGMQYTPGTVIPGEGMIIDGGSAPAGQVPYLPAPATSPQTVPAPTTPGPQPGT